MKKSIALFLLLIECFVGFAQTEIPVANESLTKRVKAERKKIIKETPFIFEGIVIKSEGFFIEGKGVFTSNIIQITKIFRGSPALKIGTIEIITEGGTAKAVLKDGSIGERFTVNTGHGQVSGSLGVGQEATFFCSPADSDLLVLPLSTDNTVRTKFSDCVSYAGGVKGLHLSFKSKEELYHYLDKQKNIIVPKEALEKKKIETSEEQKIKTDTSGNSLRYQQNLKNYATFLQNIQIKIDKATATKNAANTAKSIDATNDLTLSFANPIQTAVGATRYFEFDVMASANSSSTFFDNALLRIAYNTSAFGNNVVANNKVTITKGVTFNSATYTTPDADKIDQTSSVIGVPFGTDFTQASWNRTLLTTTPVQLLHLKFEIQTCNTATNISFADVTFTPNFSFYSTIATANIVDAVPYDNTTYGGSMSNTLCQLLITSFNSPVNAGTGDILTINGTGFGATRGTGQVRFKNADDGGATYLYGLNAYDYISWSNTQIKIKVPSIDSLSGTAGFVDKMAGSGTFIVRNSFADSAVTSTNLQIYYGVLSTNDNTPTYKKLRSNIVNIDGSGGYTIHLNSNISSNAGAKGCIIKAMNDWKCYTGVNWKLGADTPLATQAADGSSVFYFGVLPVGNLALTKPQGVNCDLGANSYSIIDEADIAFDQGANWFYDTTGLALPAGKFDFYEVALHELGHFLLHTHVNDINELMYFAAKFNAGSSIPAINRRHLSPVTGATDGGSSTVSNSIATIVGSCGYVDMIPQYSSACAAPPVDSEPTAVSYPDLYIKDNIQINLPSLNPPFFLPEDFGTEPNVGAPWHIVDGTDVWVRNSGDTKIQTSPARYANENQHEDVEWTTQWQSNDATLPRIYAKVRNRGNAAVSGRVHLYYHKSTTNDHWGSCSSMCGSWQELYKGDTNGNDMIDGGEMIAYNDITLGVGEIGVIEQTWNRAKQFPDPTVSGNRNEYCLLARLVCNGGVDQIVNEQTGVAAAYNAQSSNNIVQKNVVFVNNTPGIVQPPDPCFGFGNYASIASLNQLNFREESATTFTGQHGGLTLELSPVLYEAWVQGGRQGSGIRTGKEKFNHSSPSGTAHRHSGSQTNLARVANNNVIIVDAPVAYINNINIPPNDPFPTDPEPICPQYMYFATANLPIPERFEQVFYQSESFGNGQPSYNFTGAVRYFITKPNCNEVNAGSDISIGKECVTNLTASPILPDATYIWRNSKNGKDIGSGSIIQVSPKVTTTYEVEMTLPNHCVAYDEVTVTVSSQNTCFTGNCNVIDYNNQTLTSNTVISGTQITVNRTLRVPNNTTLTIINSVVNFTENSEIVVMRGGKLIIIDSKLRSCDITKKWTGITVLGNNNDAGQLKISGSTIMNALNPITMTKVVDAVIVTNVFDNGVTAITMDKCTKFTISKNEFYTYDVGIKAINSIVNVESIISENYFKNVKTAVLLDGGNHSALSIRCNLFEDYTDYAVYSNNATLSNQGSLTEGAGNSFISSSVLPNNKFKHNGNSINYYYDPSDPIILSTGAGMNVIVQAATNDGTCVVETSSFKTDNTSNTALSISEIAVNKSELLNCIPNPAANSTTILYTLPVNSKSAELTIVSVLGAVVAKYPLASGTNSVEVDCKNFANGIYYYSLIVDGNLISAKKMAVSK